MLNVLLILSQGIATGNCSVTHRDFWSNVDKSMALDLMSEPEQTIVLCAFTMSQLSSAAARERMVKEIWGTGADVMVRLSVELVPYWTSQQDIGNHRPWESRRLSRRSGYARIPLKNGLQAGWIACRGTGGSHSPIFLRRHSNTLVPVPT